MTSRMLGSGSWLLVWYFLAKKDGTRNTRPGPGYARYPAFRVVVARLRDRRTAAKFVLRGMTRIRGETLMT